MPPHVIDAIAPLIALLGTGTFVLLGMRIYLGYKAKRLELGAGVPRSEVDAAVQDLKNEIHLLRGEVGELQERVDFAERLLARGQRE